MTEHAPTTRKKASLFEMGGLPSLKDVAPLGLQHVVAAIVGVITPAIMVANTCNIQGADRTMLIQMSLIIAALATLLQLFPIGRIGAGLPVIIGASFAYVPTLQAIGGQFDIATIFGAQICGGIAAFLVGLFIKQIRKLFPSIVTGTVIFTIGLSLYSVAIKYMGGGVANASYGSGMNWLVAIFTFVVVVICNYYTKGFFKLASILVGVVAGYILALFLKMVDFGDMARAGWLQWIPPLHFGLSFDITAIISMVVMYVVNAVQAIGDFSSTTIGGLDREPTDKELSGGIMANGITSIISAFLGGLPTATYSQNVGIVTVNRVVNKSVFAFAAAILLLAGLSPKFAGLLTTIPQSVIGGATLSVFAMITMTGIRMISSNKLTARNTAIVGLSVALGVGIVNSPGCLQGLPEWVNTVFGSSSVVIATLMAIILNLVLPKDPPEAAPAAPAKHPTAVPGDKVANAQANKKKK